MVNGSMENQLITNRAHLLLVLLCLLAVVIFYFGYPCPAIGSDAATTEGENAFNPRTGTFLYAVKWGGTPTGQIIMTVSRQGEYYRVVADSMVTKSIDFIYRLRYRGEGTINKNTFGALRTVLTEQKGSESKVTKIAYRENGEIETKVTRQKKKEAPEITVKNFRPDREVLDIFSAVFLSRSFNWRVGLAERFEVYTGRKTYLVTLNCIQKIEYQEANIDAIDAWVIAPAVIDPYKPNRDARLTATRIFLSADNSKDILKIKTKTGFGTIEALLTDFVPF
jgi:hypothetical protein